MVVTKNTWPTTLTITPRGQLRKWKRTQEGNTNRAGVRERMAIQSTSARFAGKMNFRRVLAHFCLLRYPALVLPLASTFSNIDLEFWLTHSQQLWDNKDTAMAQITNRNDHLQRLWALSKSSQRCPTHNFQATFRHTPRHTCWTKKKCIAHGAVIRIPSW
jgi:hypothetical protein